MRPRAILCTTSLLSAAALLTACGGTSVSSDGKDKAALIIAEGGLSDGSYNDIAYSGFKKSVKAAGIKGSPVESNDIVGQGDQILRRAAQSNGLVVDLEAAHNKTISQVAKDFPKVKFGFLNLPVKGDNIASVTFEEQEGSYLAGALAAQMTKVRGNPKINKQKVIGVIGGVKVAGIDKFLVGYAQGARAVDPSVKVLVSYANSFGDPAKGKQLAQSMYQQGADIVYAVAGGTGTGVIEAAKSSNHYAIGVDTDQDAIAPGYVLTSMVKRTDLAVQTLVQNFADDKFKARTTTLGLKDGGVGLTKFTYTKSAIPAEARKKVDAYKKQIIDGDLKVWNTMTDGYPSWFKR